MVDAWFDAATVIDAHYMYSIIEINIKLGASNIAVEEYGQVLGSD
jgi:hypothetical protein